MGVKCLCFNPEEGGSEICAHAPHYTTQDQHNYSLEQSPYKKRELSVWLARTVRDNVPPLRCVL
jgi:hypothetical protein